MHKLTRLGIFAVFLLLFLVSASTMTVQGESSLQAMEEAYDLCGRVFPDPHAYWPSSEQVDQRSPYAKGNAVCASTDFITFQKMIDGMAYLESLFPGFIEFYNLEEDFGDGIDCESSASNQALCSAGLPRLGTDGPERMRSDLYMVRLTDERIPEDNKKFYVFPLSIHGIERAGAEAGVRAAEDLATWGYCEAVQNGELPANDLVNCAQEGAIPHPLLEAQPAASVTAGEALTNAAVYLIFPNPDGWRRGDPDNIARFYQRYNGNGVDLNRDWPTIGFTYQPYTPWSEPETRGFGKVLKEVRDQWDGGIDLHGQLIDRAFSFTLLGASERDFAKNQSILQTVKGAWSDAEARLAWSPVIKPNHAAPQPDDPRMYGVQWGTVWDTIGYTITGGLGDWIESPLGLGGDGINNEMSMSHLINCGIGSCYLPDFEQLHVDGNKSLMYAMVNYGLQPENTDFDVPGKVAYIHNPKVLENDGTKVTGPPYTNLDPQPDIMDVKLDADNNFTHVFRVYGPQDKKPNRYYNGGLEGKATAVNVGGISGDSLTSLVLERFRPTEEGLASGEGCGTDEDDDYWAEVNRYYNQSSIYLQSGQAVHANDLTAGWWRICVTGGLVSKMLSSGGHVDLDITFSREKGWEDPGQLPYSVTNMKFFQDLAQYMAPNQLVPVNVDDVLRGKVDLNQFASVIVADDPLPGYIEPIPTGEAQPTALDTEPTEASATAPCFYPTQPVLPPTCYVTYEFDVLSDEYNNQQLVVEIVSDDLPENDWDLYVERKSKLTGEWGAVSSSTTATGNEKVTIANPPAGEYRAKIVSWLGTKAPKRLTATFSNVYTGPDPEDSTRTPEERDAWGAALRGYVEGGGNLVLTDGALKAIAYMDLLPRSAVGNTTVFAGYIGFTRDGGQTDTYDDPLAKDVNQPGAAEGSGHRHQTYEPVPIGYSIASGNSAPAWGIDQFAWEAAGGRTAGTTTGEMVSLGELPVGAGQVRVIGSLLPFPTDRFYHPFGLSNYALTYTGYQVLHNALQD